MTFSGPHATFIRSLPKAELHLHLEGALEPELAFSLAARNGMTLAHESVDALRRAYAFNRLQDFLDIYYQGMAVLREAADFYDLTLAYCERADADTVRHVELFFDPQAHMERGVSIDTVLDGITGALEEARSRFGLTSGLIPCFLRHLSEASAEQTLDALLARREDIIGVGLDSSELGHPPARFERVFARARDAGLRLVAHAGEEGPPEYVREALDVLGVHRIDHGNRALEDAALVERLAREQVALTVCPLSNLRLRVVDELSEHPLRRMLHAGLKATVNSDDPAYFGGYVNANFMAVEEALALTREELETLARNSFEAAFVCEQRRAELVAELDTYLA